jgi:hypothetical protein
MKNAKEILEFARKTATVNPMEAAIKLEGATLRYVLEAMEAYSIQNEERAFRQSRESNPPEYFSDAFPTFDDYTKYHYNKIIRQTPIPVQKKRKTRI